MHSQTWSDVDLLLERSLLSTDPALEHCLSASAAAGLPSIAVSPLQGQFLFILATSIQARHILEVGTLGGYSTICLARALPPRGRLISLELDPRHAAVAVQNLAHAGMAERVEVRVGAALDSLATMARESHPPFDLVFIDADKANNAAYFRHALTLTRPGGLILVDNIVRAGAILDGSTDDPGVRGVRSLLNLVRDEPRIVATAIQTVGGKGYDGLLVARLQG